MVDLNHNVERERKFLKKNEIHTNGQCLKNGRNVWQIKHMYFRKRYNAYWSIFKICVICHFELLMELASLLLFPIPTKIPILDLMIEAVLLGLEILNRPRMSFLSLSGELMSRICQTYKSAQSIAHHLYVLLVDKMFPGCEATLLMYVVADAPTRKPRIRFRRFLM